MWTQRGLIWVWTGDPIPVIGSGHYAQLARIDSLGDIYPPEEARRLHNRYKRGEIGSRHPSVIAGHRQHVRAREVAA